MNEIPPLDVNVVSGTVNIGNDKRKVENRTSHRTVVLTANNPTYNVAGYDPARKEVYINVLDNPVVLSDSTSMASDQANTAAAISITPTQPGIPASGVAVQNTNQVPVQVVIAGFTATQVFVNGIQVGTGNGTYTVPANGAISITYTIAGTWTWTFVTAQFSSLGLTTPNGRILPVSNGSEYCIPGSDEMWLSTNTYPTRVGITIVREI